MQIEKEKALKLRGLALVLLTFPVALSAAAPIVLEAGRHQIAFDPANGSIVRVSESGATDALLRNDDCGLWELKFHEPDVVVRPSARPDVRARRGGTIAGAP